MPNLRAPGLGPIVGHTTSTSARIWIRAADPHDSGSMLDDTRRTIGVVATVEKNGRRIRNPEVHYFRLHREFDRTGTFTLGQDLGVHSEWDAEDSKGLAHPPLKPDSEYKAVAGVLTLDDPFPRDMNIDDADLARYMPDPDSWRPALETLEREESSQSVATFRTFPSPPRSRPVDSLSFILGSCRYPGLLWKAKESDRIFGPLCDEAHGNGVVEAGESARPHAAFVMMAGDQIYADMLNRHVPIGLADTFSEFQERYHQAFGSRNMRRLLRSTPTYMILDDHEIEDNWHQDRMAKTESRRVFNIGIGAYMSYQWSHGPRTWGRRLYSRFDCGGYPWFILDTRTQRFMDDVADSLNDNHMLGRPSLAEEEPNQLDHLVHWLRESQKKQGNVPKFIVTSSVFAPSPMTARTEGLHVDEMDAKKIRKLQESDSWPGFPRTRKRILETILQYEVQNVIFLAGDIHCANVAEIEFSGSAAAERIKAFSIVSSAFYWPFFFADGDPSNFVHDSKADDQRDTFHIDERHSMDYRAWNFTQENNFSRIDIDRESATLSVQPFGDDGRKIRKQRNGQSEPMQAILHLESW